MGCLGIRGTSAEITVFDASDDAGRLAPVSALRGSVSGFEFGGSSLRALDVTDAALLGGRVRAVRARSRVPASMIASCSAPGSRA